MKIGIVVITYNRDHCLLRLLDILNKADYGADLVDLIISVDYCPNTKAYNVANNFEWKHGIKKVRRFEKNLGLRKHVLACGELTKNYDAIVVFEDDVIPSLYFYDYVKQSVEFYKDDLNIAGISLYKHLWNVGNYTAFNPETSPKYDAYFMQYAQSWGQVWTKRMWHDFYEWYKLNNEEFIECYNVPNNVCKWPKSSWLKYYIRYVIETNKYFVYPNIALSTNCGDAGTHNASSPNYQVELLNNKIEVYNFPFFNKSAIRYDAYFERENLKEILGLEDLCIDLYGMKNNANHNRYYLTLKKENYKILKSYSLSLKPIEFNIIFDLKGSDIFLYDTTIIEENKIADSDKKINLKKLIYSSRGIPRKDMLTLAINSYKSAIFRKIKKIVKK